MSKTIYAAAVLFFCFCQFTASAGWQSYGPYGGNVTCLTVSGSTIFAGCGYNGIYLSSDSGANWKEVISGLAPSTSVNSLASCNNGNIFAGTSTGVYLYNYNSATWNLAGLGQLTVQCLQTFGGSVVAYAYSGLDTSTCTLLMSTDNGNTWNYTGFTYLGKVNALAASDQYLYAATDTGIYVSSDSAESWTLTLSNEFYTNKTIVLAANRGNIVTGTTQGAIYFSSDHGFNWLQIDTANFNFQNGLVINTLVFGDSGIFIAARNASAGCEIILTGYNNDNSANVSAGISPLLTISAFAFSGSNIFAATTAGVYISTDYGGNWHPVNNGMLNVTISALTANATNIFAGGADGMYGSANHGARWTPLDSGLGNIYNPDFLFVTALCANYSGIFAGTMPGNIYVSHNNGVSWINIGGAPLTGGIFSLYTDSATIYAVAGGDFIYIL